MAECLLTPPHRHSRALTLARCCDVVGICDGNPRNLMYELEFTSLGSADMMKDLNGGDHRIRDMTLQKCAAKCDGFDYIAMTSGAPVASHQEPCSVHLVGTFF